MNCKDFLTVVGGGLSFYGTIFILFFSLETQLNPNENAFLAVGFFIVSIITAFILSCTFSWLVGYYENRNTENEIGNIENV